MTSKEYWQKRETEHAKKNKMSEQTYAEEIRKTYAYMADQIQKEIDGFYAKYANAEKISLAEAKRRVSNKYSANGYSGTWNVESTAGVKAGDTVFLRVANTTVKGYSRR